MKKTLWRCILTCFCCLALASSCEDYGLKPRCVFVVFETTGHYAVGELWTNYTAPDGSYFIRIDETKRIADTVWFRTFQTRHFLTALEDDEILEILIIDEDKYEKKFYNPKESAYYDESIVLILQTDGKELKSNDFTIVINDDMIYNSHL